MSKEEKRLMLKDIKFTVSIELKNIRKAIYEDGSSAYAYDLYINGKVNSARKDIVMYTGNTKTDVINHAVELLENSMGY